MFDSVRNSKRIVQFILFLLILPFALWGIDSYVRNVGPGTDVASVAGSKITVIEFQRALRDQQDRMRKTLGGELDQSALDTDEIRTAVLDGLVSRTLLARRAADLHLSVGDAQLQQMISAIPDFQTGGSFSIPLYDAFVRSQGLTRDGFEARMRQQIAMQQIAQAVTDTAVVSDAEIGRWLSLQQEERVVSEAVVRVEQFLAEAKPDDKAIKAYYDANAKLFEVPEQVKAEYVLLDQAALGGDVTVKAEEVRGYYENNRGRYKQPEERHARHILVAVDADASEDKLAAAKKKATDLATQLRADPDKFPEIAKKVSEDPGSAANGGDLGVFSRGAMVPAFENVAFSLKKGEISDPVRSDFGFHVIQVTDILAERGKDFAEVRSEIEQELRKQAAGRKFSEAAEAFNNLVYEQSESLKPAAERFGLTVRTTDWISKGKPGAGEFANEKLIKALFGEDAIKNRRNTPAIEVAPGKLLSARILEHKPVAVQALEAVKEDVVRRLANEEASRRAQQSGAAALDHLVKGEQGTVSFTGQRTLRRTVAEGVPPDVLRTIFRTSGKKLPAFVGGKTGDGGYAIYKILEVRTPPAPTDRVVFDTLRSQLARVSGQRDMTAYLAALRSDYAVKINQAAVLAKER